MTTMRDFFGAGGGSYDDETDDLAQDAMNFFSGIPVVGGIIQAATGGKQQDTSLVGQAVKGVTGGGGSTASTSSPIQSLLGGLTGGGGGIGGMIPSPASLLSKLPMPPMPPMPMMGAAMGLPVPPIPNVLIPALGQGIGQATGITPASTGIGALLGAGMGGLPFGTGPFPGALGEMMQRRFGGANLPPAWSVEPASVTRGDWRDAADHAERVGRAVVSRVTGTTGPQLAEIRRWLRQRAAQIQATAEHRAVMSDADFKSTVVEQLLQLRRQLGLVPGGAAPTMYGPAAGSAGVVSKY